LVILGLAAAGKNGAASMSSPIDHTWSVIFNAMAGVV
jgi:hypothetical protein